MEQGHYAANQIIRLQQLLNDEFPQEANVIRQFVCNFATSLRPSDMADALAYMLEGTTIANLRAQLAERDAQLAAYKAAYDDINSLAGCLIENTADEECSEECDRIEAELAEALATRQLAQDKGEV